MPYNCYAQNDLGSDEEVIKLADELFRNAEYARAMPLYSQLLSLHPKDPFYSYRFGVSMLYTDRSDPERPLRFIEKGSGLLSGDDARMIYFHLGVAYHQAFRFGEAIKAFKGFINENNSINPQLCKESELRIQMCKNGIELLSNVKDIFVLQKSEVVFQNFFRSYDLKNFGGNLLGKPDFLKTKLDKKLGDFSIVFFSDTHRVVYYSSYGKKNTNGKDIYRVTKNPNGEWGEPERLSNVINTPYDEDFPYLLPDGRTLYFCSKGHNSMGGYDIFKSEYDSVRGEWSRPINVDFAINSPFDDILFITDPDQRFAYFSSTRNSQEGQIMVYKVRIDRRPDDSFQYDPQMLAAESIEISDSMYLLTIEQIRQRANLDVNANEDMFPDSNGVASTNNVNDNARYNIPENPTEQDVVDLAFFHVGDAESEMFKLRNLRDAALKLADLKKSDADRFRIESDETFDKANQSTDPAIRQKLFAQATALSKQSEHSNDESEMARNMYLQYSQAADLQAAKLNSMQDRAGRIQQLAGSRQIDTSVVLLKKLIDDIDTFKIEVTDIVHRISNGGNDPDEMRNQQNVLLAESTNLINEANRLNQEAIQYRNEAALVKDPELKQEYLDESRSLDSLANIKRNTSEEKTDQANQLQQQIDSQADQNQLLASIADQIAILVDTDTTLAQNVNVGNIDNNNPNNGLQTNNNNQTNTQDNNNATNGIVNANNNPDSLSNNGQFDIVSNGNQTAINDSSQQSVVNPNNGLQANNNNQINNQQNNNTTNGIVNANNNPDSINNHGQNNNISANGNQNVINDSTQQNVANYRQRQEELASSRIDSIQQFVYVAEQKSKAIQGLLNQKLLILKEKEDAINIRIREGVDINSSEIQSMNSDYADILQQVLILDELNGLYRARLDSLQQIYQTAEQFYSQANSPSDSIAWTKTNIELNNLLAATELLESQTIYQSNEQGIREIMDQTMELSKQSSALEKQEKRDQTILAKAEQQLAEAKNEKSRTKAQNEVNEARFELDSIQKLITNVRNEQIILSNQRNSLEKRNNLTEEMFRSIEDFNNEEINTAISYSNETNQELYNRYLSNVEESNDVFSTDYLAPAITQSQIIALNNNQINNSTNNTNSNSSNNNSTNQENNSSISDAGNELLSFTDGRGSENETQNSTISESITEINQSRFYEYAANTVVIRIQSVRKDLQNASGAKRDSLENELTILENSLNSLMAESDFYFGNATNLAKLNGDVIPSNVPELSPEYVANGYMEQYLNGMQQADSIREIAMTTTNSRDSLRNMQLSVEVEDAAWNRYLNALEVYGVWNESRYNRAESIIHQALSEGKGPLSSRTGQILETARKNFAEARGLRAKSKSIASVKEKIPLNEKALELEKQSLTDLNTVIEELLGSNNQADFYADIILQTERESNVSIDSVIQIELRNLADSNNIVAVNNNSNQSLNANNNDINNNTVSNNNSNNQQNQSNQNNSTTNQSNGNNNQTATNNNQNNIPSNGSQNTTASSSNENPADSVNVNNITLVAPGSANYISFYNEARPIKIEEAIQSGLYYRVQIAASRKMVSPETFKGIDPLTAESGQGWIRYMAGFFTKFAAAKNARDKIRPMGYADAFVVAYYNGKRITIAEARDLEANGTIAANPDSNVSSTATALNQGNNNSIAVSTPIENVSILTYTVQVGVYAKPRSSATLFGITSLIEERLANGYYRYFSGSYSNMDEALIAQNNIRRKGVPDAFVVILFNGKKISAAEATTLIKNGNSFKGDLINAEKVDSQKTNATETSTNVPVNVVFKIQIGAYSKDVPVDIVNKLIELSKSGVEKYLDESGMTIYTSGNFRSYKEALASRDQINNNGLNDAFIVAFSNGKKIPLTETLKNQNP